MRIVLFMALVASVTFSVIGFYPYAKKLLSSTYTIRYYEYKPAAPVQSLVDISTMPPANAVPVLMYHGVTKKEDESNTTIKNFISHMEMLKRNGYETISVREFDMFRQGKFILPPKPIIITFDDGRKDSYYTTDSILKTLGYKATIFVATGMALEGNSFYLSFDELASMISTGRWEIEAHGRYAHEPIPISSTSRTARDMGRYLTSRAYVPAEDRVETAEEFEQRVESDYQASIKDLETHLAITPRYFAIPLNDYGQQPVSNHPEAVSFNQTLIRKYFDIAFVQVNQSDNVTVTRSSVYNFRNSDPHQTGRIEVKNMSADELKALLEKDAPTPPYLNLAGQQFAEAEYNAAASEGVISYSADGLRLQATAANRNGQVVFGQDYWQDYSIKAAARRDAGRSIVILFYYKDTKNYLSCGLTDNGYFLRSTVDGKTTDLKPSQITEDPKTGIVTFEITVNNRSVTAVINNQALFAAENVPIDSGAVGFKVWGGGVKGNGLLQSLHVTAL